MSLFQNKFRIESTRLQGWDYGSNSMYFVTICTHNKEQFLGEIINGSMQCSMLGAVADHYWKDIPKHFPFVIPDEHVIMPNHVHGILIIDKSIEHWDSPNSIQGNKYGPQSKNLASVIRGYKAAVTTYATTNNIIFKWQARYHDHIIRDNNSYTKIRNYIISNPMNWKEDKFYD